MSSPRSVTLDRQIKDRQLRDIIEGQSLPPYVKNKMGNNILSGQNHCYSTEVKKSYFGHTFHLRPKQDRTFFKVKLYSEE